MPPNRKTPRRFAGSPAGAAERGSGQAPSGLRLPSVQPPPPFIPATLPPRVPAPPATPWPSWPFELSACVLLAAGLGLLVWALWDRRRGRRRCDRCWYDLAGLTLPESASDPRVACPECGRIIRTRRQTLRSRRRPVVALFALALMLGSSVLPHVPDYRRLGWKALVPSGVLIAQAYVLPPLKGDPLSEELLERVLSGRGMWHWQQRWGARLLGPRLMTYRDRWPEGVPIYLPITRDVTLRDEALRQVPIAGPSPSISLYMGLTGGLDAEVLTPLPPGSHHLPIWITLRDGRQVPSVLPIHVGGTLDEHLRPHAHDPAVVRDVLRPRLMDLDTAGLVIDIRASAWAGMRRQPFPSDLAVEMILLDGTQPVARAHWKSGGPTASGLRLPATQVRLIGDESDLARARAAIMGTPAQRARWSVRFQGDPGLALSDPHSSGYWSGSFAMTLDELLNTPP